jgi:predicted SAM-dependent methyltransferase
MPKLNLGCGSCPIPGWYNYDIEPGEGRLVFDLTNDLPHQSATVDCVYSEHFIEHLTRRQGQKLLAESYRVLKPSGVIRISTPDLGALIRDYTDHRLDRWADMGWQPKSVCQLVNEGMRRWGHLFLYDQAELNEALQMAGFCLIRRCVPDRSGHDILSGLETRPDHSDLILEGTKP